MDFINVKARVNKRNGQVNISLPKKKLKIIGEEIIDGEFLDLTVTRKNKF